MKCIKSILIIPVFDTQERGGQRERDRDTDRETERNEYRNVVNDTEVWTSASKSKLSLSWISHLSRENGVPGKNVCSAWRR